MSNESPIVQEVVLDASPERVWRAYMDSDEHAAFTGGPAQIGAKAGEAFSCHGGRIGGRNVELVPNTRIVQAWRSNAWPDGVYSVVRFELAADGARTRLTMTHAGVPDDAVAAIRDGWTARYWTPLQAYLAASA